MSVLVKIEKLQITLNQKNKLTNKNFLNKIEMSFLLT